VNATPSAWEHYTSIMNILAIQPNEFSLALKLGILIAAALNNSTFMFPFFYFTDQKAGSFLHDRF